MNKIEVINTILKELDVNVLDMSFIDNECLVWTYRIKNTQVSVDLYNTEELIVGWSSDNTSNAKEVNLDELKGFLTALHTVAT